MFAKPLTILATTLSGALAMIKIFAVMPLSPPAKIDITNRPSISDPHTLVVFRLYRVMIPYEKWRHCRTSAVSAL